MCRKAARSSRCSRWRRTSGPASPSCRAASAASTREVLSLFPVLKDMLSRRGGDLSGGQQQQLAIARALMTQPKILVLDEPTEGIQPSIIKDIGNAIRHLKKTTGMAFLLVEQYLDFCRELADHVYIMDRGEVVHAGPRRGSRQAGRAPAPDGVGPLSILSHNYVTPAKAGVQLWVVRGRESWIPAFAGLTGILLLQKKTAAPRGGRLTHAQR